MYEAMASAGVCSSHDAGSRIFFPGGGDCEGHGSQCEGGYLEVGYFDEETGNEVCLPIGEVSEVPKGVELDITANQIAYQTSQTEEIRTFVQSASVNGKPHGD